MKKILMALFGLAIWAPGAAVAQETSATLSAECEWKASISCSAVCNPTASYFQCDVDPPECSGKIPTECSAEVQAAASCDVQGCSASCEAECTANPPKFSCTSECQAKLEADCTAKIDANCQSRCASEANQASCESSCKSELQGTCKGQGSASCDAKCQGTKGTADCKGTCKAACEGGCDAQAQARATCDGYLRCKSPLKVQCQTDFKANCEGQCQSSGGALVCNGQVVSYGDLNAVKEWFKSHGYATGSSSASCEGNTCKAEASGEAGLSCAASPVPAGEGATAALGLLAVGYAVSRLRRRRRLPLLPGWAIPRRARRSGPDGPRSGGEIPMIDLNEMVLFARVVSRGSFTEAARELGVPASTLSRKVSALEERLGVRLLERTTRQLRLTDAGELYYKHCSRLSREAEEADHSVMALQNSPRGTLRVTAPPFFAESNLAPVIAEYGRRCPEVQLVMVLADRMVDLVSEGFDLAIRVAAGFSDSSLVLRKVGKTSAVLCASPEYLQRRGAPLDLADLDQHSVVGYSFETGGAFHWRFLGDDGKLIEKALTPRLVVNSFWLTRELCRSGEGLAMLPASLAGPDLASGRLVRLLPAVKTRSLDVGVVTPSARQTPAKVRVFLDLLERGLAL